VSKVETPLKWLLSELPAYIEPSALAALLERYHLHKANYERQIKINQVERVIKSIQHRNNPNDAAKLARWHSKLAKLKEDML
jgi:hypothetical protein